jgi:hypothetical protein
MKKGVGCQSSKTSFILDETGSVSLESYTVFGQLAEFG